MNRSNEAGKWLVFGLFLLLTMRPVAAKVWGKGGHLLQIWPK